MSSPRLRQESDDRGSHPRLTGIREQPGIPWSGRCTACSGRWITPVGNDGVRTGCCAQAPTGVKSRLATNGGLRLGAANGSTHVFSTLLNTMNTFDRG